MAALTDKVNVGVGVIVRNSRDHVLLGKRTGAHGAGEYSLPGGKPDPGEDPAYAACRELYEETGLVPFGLAPVPTWTYDRFEAEGIHFVTLYFQCWVDADPRNREPDKCEGWVWFDPLELPDPLFSGVKDALKAT